MKNEGKIRVSPGHDTIQPIRKNQVTHNKKVTYARFCYDHIPQNDEQYKCRMTAGGEQLDYDGEKAVEISGMETTKILINSTISTKGARNLAGDIVNMYTNSMPETLKLMQINIRDITQEVIDKYHFMQIIKPNGFVYFAIHGAMYRLAQSEK